MAEPADNQPKTAYVSNAPVILRIILIAFLALPGLAGLATFCGVAGEWAYDGMQIKQDDRWIMPLFIVGSQSFVCFSVLTIGIVLRFARWRHARIVSLILSLISVAVIVLGYQLLLDSFAIDDTDDRELSLVFSVIGLIVISVPPFLHWWVSGKKLQARDATKAP